MIRNINIYNMYDAIRGMRKSYKSEDKMDSGSFQVIACGGENIIMSYNHCVIGPDDEILIKKLLKSRSERKFLRQILVSMDIRTSIKHWAQIDTYKVGTVRNLESTMHCIIRKELVQADFMKEVPDVILKQLNYWINEWHRYNERKDVVNKKIVFDMIDNCLTGGCILESHWTANYEVLRSIYSDRKHHKMFYWKEFCSAITKLPYFELLIGGLNDARKNRTKTNISTKE